MKNRHVLETGYADANADAWMQIYDFPSLRDPICP